MIIENTFYKRNAVLHTRLPEEVKQAFQVLAQEKGKTASTYMLELVLNELKKEAGSINQFLTHNYSDHDK